MASMRCRAGLDHVAQYESVQAGTCGTALIYYKIALLFMRVVHEYPPHTLNNDRNKQSATDRTTVRDYRMMVRDYRMMVPACSV